MPDPVMQPTLEEALGEAVAEVLEKMFFIRILEDPQSAVELSGPAEERRADGEIVTKVTFHGEPSGRLSLRLDRRLARAIAADFLGEEEPELEPREVEDVMRELANMVCGAVLTHVESSILFRLDEPVIADADAVDSGPPETVMHAFPIGGGALTVKMWMEAPQWGSAEKSVF